MIQNGTLLMSNDDETGSKGVHKDALLPLGSQRHGKTWGQRQAIPTLLRIVAQLEFVQRGLADEDERQRRAGLNVHEAIRHAEAAVAELEGR